MNEDWSEFFQKEHSFDDVVIKFMNESDFLDFEEMKIHSKESLEEIKNRIIRNLKIRQQLNWDDKAFVVEYLIKKYVGEGSPQRTPKQVLFQFKTIDNFVEKLFEKKKREEPLVRKLIERTGRKIYEMDPSKELELLIQCYYEYFTRPPTQKMRTIVREETGIGKNWNAFSWDYYEFFDTSHGDRKIVKYSTWNRDSIDKKTINSFKEKCVDQLVKCISDGIEGYTFNENEIELMKNNIQNMLYKKLKKINSKNTKKFVSKWRSQMTKKCEMLIIRLNDEKLLQQFDDTLYEEKHPFEKIKKLVVYENKEYRFKIQENKTIEYKSGIFADKERVESDYKKIKKSNKNISFTEFYKIKTKAVQDKILKCIVAFLNTSGGKIIIGVDNTTLKISGIKKEKEKLGGKMSDGQFMDLYGQRIDGMIQRQKDVNANFDDNVNYSIFEIPNGKIICLIQVKLALNAAHLPYAHYYEGKTGTAYLRKSGNCIPQESTAWQEHIQKLMKKQ